MIYAGGPAIRKKEGKKKEDVSSLKTLLPLLSHCKKLVLGPLVSVRESDELSALYKPEVLY